MKANEYKVLEDCVERGIDAGYAKAFKHTFHPEEHQLKEAINHYVLLEISEYFEFNENNKEEK